jgi:hypothetical protein
MITERRPDVSPFSAIEFIANWLSWTFISQPLRSRIEWRLLRRAVRSAHRQKMGVTTSDLSYFKTQQWAVTNYSLLRDPGVGWGSRKLCCALQVAKIN